jgi:hypothetical protein
MLLRFNSNPANFPSLERSLLYPHHHPMPRGMWIIETLNTPFRRHSSVAGWLQQAILAPPLLYDGSGFLFS